VFSIDFADGTVIVVNVDLIAQDFFIPGEQGGLENFELCHSVYKGLKAMQLPDSPAGSVPGLAYLVPKPEPDHW